MNRTFLLALTLVFAFACSPQPGPNNNGTANSNSTANGNHAGDGIAVEAASKPVVITVGTKPSTDTYYLSVAPDTVYLSASQAEQIEWIVSNPFPNVNLSNVQIGKFKGGITPNTDPFGNGGTFTFSYVAPQAAAHKLSGTTAKYGTYTYEVTGTATIGDGAPKTLKMDPRVVVGD